MAVSQFSDASLPGSGQLLAVHSGTTLEFGGAIQKALIIETFGNLPATPPGTARLGDPLTADGVTIWIAGSFPALASGAPTSDTRANVLAAWDALRAKLLTADYELFLHYDAGASPLYRKHRLVNTAVLRAHWANPLGLVYELGAITTTRTLYTSAPGMS